MADDTDDLEKEGLEPSPLAVSDEDFANFSLDDLDDEKTLDEEKKADEDANTEVEEDDDLGEAGEADTSTDDTDDKSDDKVDLEDDSDDTINKDEESAADTDTSDDKDVKAVETDKDLDKPEEKDSEKEETSGIDYKAEYERLISPFRANNRDMQIDNVEDARTLMKMGANYNKKMAGLKPNLKLIKMLENNELLDESKLSYLIDLDKKNPEAIRKLVKESGINPMDIDVEGEAGYKKTNYTVDDKEVELDGILDDIQETESFNQTIDIISNKWDESSKEVILGQPSIIKVINEHVAAGIFEQISGVVEQERALGKLTGLSDLAAYKQIGDAINANGGFTSSNSNIEETKTVPTIPNKKTSDPKLKSKKRAASSTKSTVKKGVKQEFNPLSLSDEDFEKEFDSKFLT